MAEKHDLGSKGSLGISGKTGKDIIQWIKNENIKLVDAVFTDPIGLWQHCTFTSNQLDDEAFDVGLPFDGSSIKLFTEINESDMIMRPDPNTAWIDPFHKEKTLHIICSITEPESHHGYPRDPRSIAKKALEYLKSTGIADTAYFGPEAEFFIFDDVRYEFANNRASFYVDGAEGPWNTSKHTEGGNLAHRQEHKGWYFPVPPIDTTVDLRTGKHQAESLLHTLEMLLTMGTLGVPIEKHHHEVATCQVELGFRALPLIECADNLMTYKYVVKNVAKKHNKTATFMPKPILGDNGTGMHVHQSLWKDGKPLFYDDKGKYLVDRSQTLESTRVPFVGLHYWIR